MDEPSPEELDAGYAELAKDPERQGLHMRQEQAAPVPASFEGDVISAMEGRMAPIVFDMPEGYARGTILRMEVEVRIKNVRYEEDRKGQLIRQHVLVLETIALKAAYQPHEAVEPVGGSAAPKQEQTPEEAEEIGIEIGRTSKLWGEETLTTSDVITAATGIPKTGPGSCPGCNTGGVFPHMEACPKAGAREAALYGGRHLEVDF